MRTYSGLRDTAHIGRYEIRKELGRGMMGVVYEAHDPALGRTIALKTISLALGGSRREREEYERRFLAEARIAARLSHPGIVVVHDVGRDERRGILYIALEHLHGRTLDQIIAEKDRPDWREALRLVARVAEALDYAHGQGVVHRDIKPANIMILASGQPKIMDFGIAKFETGHHTAAGQFFGTPLYMAPEQALGQPVDGRTDIFSLGSVAYTLITGRPPFEAENVPGVLTRVAHQAAKPGSELAAGLPADADYLLDRAMAKAPADRYPAARMLAEDADDVRAGRSPRHRAGWAMPTVGERTIASRRELPEPEAELELVDEKAPPPARRRRPLSTLLISLVAVAAAYFSLHPADVLFWRDPLAAVPEASAVASTAGELSSEVQALLAPKAEAPPPAVPRQPVPPRASPSALALAVPVTDDPGPAHEVQPFSPVPEFTVGAPESGPSSERPRPAEEPPLSGLPSPGPRTSIAPVPRDKPPAPGRLVIEFEHHIRKGNLQVWVDDKRVLDQDFDGKVVHRILSLELRKGAVQQALTLDPGPHEVRVRVSWDKNVKTSRIAGTFRPGATRRLDVDVGRLRGNLSLAWR